MKFTIYNPTSKDFTPIAIPPEYFTVNKDSILMRLNLFEYDAMLGELPICDLVQDFQFITSKINPASIVELDSDGLDLPKGFALYQASKIILYQTWDIHEVTLTPAEPREVALRTLIEIKAKLLED